jgi:hypothetical protein
MEMILIRLGAGAGILGLLLCLVAAAARLSGRFFVGGMQAGTLMQAGTAAMIAGCLAYLVVLTRRSSRGV